jgi:hypothetical protein
MLNRSARRAYYAALAIPLGIAACSGDDDAEPAAGTGAGSPSLSGAGGSSHAGAAGLDSRSGNAGGGSAGRAGNGSSGKADSGGKAGSGGTGNRGGSGAHAGSSETNGGGDAGSGEPAPSSAWVNATGNLAGLESECGNLTLVSAMPGSDLVIAGVAKRGLYATSDGGKHWASLGAAAGSATLSHRPSAIVYDPEDPSTFWESGIYSGGGLYKTVDAGVTLAQLGDISHNDLVSVDFTDPERRTLLVGGHEQKQTLYLSRDGGARFDAIGQRLPTTAHFSSYPLVLDEKTFLLGSCGYGAGECGVYRSADAGDSWERVSAEAVQARPLWASDGSIYWSIIYDAGLVRGNVDGTSWAKVADDILTAEPVELPDGRILSVRGDHVVVSPDRGEGWSPVGDTLPFKPAGITYSARTKTLFVWHWDCNGVVLDDAIASAGFDYTEQ